MTTHDATGGGGREMIEIINTEISDEEAVDAYNTLRKYCRNKDGDCTGCVFDKTNCTMHLTIPHYWEEITVQ